MTLHVAWSPHYEAPLGDHVMPIGKFRRVAEGLTADVNWLEVTPVTDTDLLRVHTEAYVRAVATGEPRALAESQKFPWSPTLATSVRWTSGGCVAAAEAAMRWGVAGNLASGFHHAFADHGEGFCTFHGLIVASEAMRAGRWPNLRVLIVDCDVHYGNGSASLVASRPWAYNLSIYGCWYENNRSTKDVTTRRAPPTPNARAVALANGSGRDVLMSALAVELPAALAAHRPDLVWYQAGADPYRRDPYSPLDLSMDDLAERDAAVFDIVRRSGVPVAWVLAGGYTEPMDDVVAIHLATAQAARRWGGT